MDTSMAVSLRPFYSHQNNTLDVKEHVTSPYYIDMLRSLPKRTPIDVNLLIFFFQMPAIEV